MHIGRREVLGLAALALSAALAIFCVVGLPALTDSRKAGSLIVSSENADIIPVDAFTQSIGVNTHINFTGPTFVAYEDLERVKTSLKYLGVHHIRDGGYYSTPTDISRLAEVARDANVKINFTLGSGGTVDFDNLHSRLLQLNKEAPGHLSAVEGANEINNLFQAENWRLTFQGQTTNMCKRDYAAAIAAQRNLYLTVKSDPELRDVSVYNLSLVYLSVRAPLNGCFTNYSEDIRSIGEQPIMADFDNIHDYPFQGAPPYDSYVAAFSRARTQPSRPIVLTETGYSTDEPRDAHPKLAVSESVQARQLLKGVLDSYKLGARRTYIYELMDNNWDHPATSLEHHYGLFRADGRPKLAAQALHNLSEILANSDMDRVRAKIPHFEVRLDEDAITAMPVHELLLQKSDGSYVLILWAEPKIWEPGKSREMPVSVSQRVSIRFRRPALSTIIFDPIKQAQPISATSNQVILKLDVADRPIFVVIR